MESDEDILQRLAKDGTMDFQSWEILLPGLIARIEKIAHTEFPVPHIPDPPHLRAPSTPSPRFLLPIPSSDTIAPTETTDTAPSSSQETDKENAVPSSSAEATSAPRPRPPRTLIQPPIAPGSLPRKIAVQLDDVTSHLMDNFRHFPPHTIQRLAELVLAPKQHYRNLTAYLHALDRVVHVTSGNNIYPLPPAVPDMSQMSLLANGVGGAGSSAMTIDTAAANILGSDESLGGALLTPIPWLSRRANGGGGSEDGAGSEDGSTSSPASTPTPGVQQATTATAAAPVPQQQAQPAPQQPAQQPQQSSAATDASSSAASTSTTRPQVRTESTETIEGPNGIGSIETVSISVNGVPSTGAVLASRGVTQGELLRQEQRAGVVPLSQLFRQAQAQQQQQRQEQQAQAESKNAEEGGGAGDSEGSDVDAAMEEQEPEVPHARGPEEIGDVDTGPQHGSSSGSVSYVIGSSSGDPGTTLKMHGIDVEAAVGRKADPSHSHVSPAEETKTSPEKHDPEVLVPRSPKREAEDDLDEGVGKKLKVQGVDSGEKEGEDAVMKVAAPVDEASAEKEGVGEPEKDAEGDVVIGDPIPPAAEVEEADEE